MYCKSMKKLVYLLLFLAIGGTATAQTLSVPDVEVLQGGTASYSVNVNVGNGNYKGFQCDVQFPATGFSIPAKPNMTVNPLWSSSVLYDQSLTNGAGHLAAVTGDTYIPTGDFEICTVTFQTAPDISLGEYTVTLSNIVFFISGDERVTLPDPVTFKVKVVSVVTLDENSTEAPTAADGVNVLVKRTIAANEWGTICLPFAMSAEQVTAAFGSDVKLCDFTGHDFEEAANGDITSITMNFEAVTPLAIEANHPYIIKVSSPVTQFSVENVDIVPEADPCIEFDNGKTGNRRVVYSGFYGTYQAQTEVPEFALFLSGGQFYYSKGLTKMKGYRAYFETQEILSKVENAAGAKIGFNIDGETTGIDNSQLSIVNSNDGWYTLDGIKLNGEPKKKGIYIKDGRKVVVK